MPDYVLNKNDAPVDDKNRVEDTKVSKEKPSMKSEKMEGLESRVRPDTTSATSLDTTQADDRVNPNKRSGIPTLNWQEILQSGLKTQEGHERVIEMQRIETTNKVEAPFQVDGSKMVVVVKMIEQCDDMIRRARAMFTPLGKPEVDITRLSVLIERKNKPTDPETEVDMEFDYEINLMEAQTMLFEMARGVRGADQSRKTLSGDICLYSKVKHLIDTEPYYNDLQLLIENRWNNQEEWYNNEAIICRKMDEAIVTICNNTDIMVCTTTGMIKLFDRFPDVCNWEVILAEEAACLSADDRYVQWRCSPNARLHLLAGDNQQPGPSSATTREDN